MAEASAPAATAPRAVPDAPPDVGHPQREADPTRTPGPAANVGRAFLVRVARGAGLALAIQLAGAGLAYASQIGFARWMGTAGFGSYAYLIAWTTIFALLAGIGFPTAVLRAIPYYRVQGDHARLRGLVRMSRAATFASGCALALLGTLIVTLTSGDGSELATLLALWLIPFGAIVNLDLAITRAGGGVFAAYAPSQVLRPLLILGASAAVWSSTQRLGDATAMAITLGAFAVVAGVQAVLVSQALRRTGPSKPSPAAYEPRRWLALAGPLLLVAGFQILLSQTDILLVGAVRGVKDAGLYAAVSKTAALVGYLLIALIAVAAPLFAELDAKGDRAGLQRFATAAAHWVFWPTLVIALALALLAPLVLGLFGPEFLTARTALTILLLGQLFSAGCGAVGSLLNMTGHQNDMARVYALVTVLNAVVCYVGVRAFGLNGAAAATTLSLIAWNVWLHRLTVKRIGVRASILSSLSAR